ncbi:hemolysin family protein [Microbacterium kribbense]|uniref:Hemolysin family protein n=1 Tax=Microbacterium kribbense TaxID=433645 RepID=A0ABP7GU68_9MICO
MTATLLLVAAVLLVALGGLTAAIDAAMGVTGRQDYLDLAEDGGRGAAQLRGIAADPDAHLHAVVFIRVLAETTAAVLVTVAFTILFGNIWWAMLAAAVLMTGISFVLVGASPRSVGRRHAHGLLRGSARIIRGLRIILGPVVQGLIVFGGKVTPGAHGASFATEEQLLSMVDEAATQDLIEEDDRDLIHSVFDFTDTFVRQVCVPRTDMVTVDAGSTAGDAMTVFLDRGVSRIPVVDDDADDVVGVLYLKDLVPVSVRDQDGWRDSPARAIARPPVFVPESMRAETLLQQMKRDAVHVCIVVDEYGSVSGLVTLEDLIEELVGEIADEYDPPQNEVVQIEPGRYRVSARLPVADVGELFDIELDDDDVDSIGGLLGKVLGRVPQPGASAVHDGLRLTGGASRGRGRGIATVFVERAPRPTQTPPAEHR